MHLVACLVFDADLGERRSNGCSSRLCVAQITAPAPEHDFGQHRCRASTK